MCGHCGVAGDITHREIDVFKELLYVSSLRGWDSTGVSVFTHPKEVLGATTVKAIGPSHNLLDSKAFDKAINLPHKKVLMGHTRAATIGDIRVANAHPFEFPRIVGAHNGTLDYNARRALPFWNMFDTDSEALISAINDAGVETVIEKAEGAWALVLVDKQDETISFLRNKERDLCYCFDKSHKTLFWASEPGFLRFVLGRKGIEIAGENGGTVWRFPEDTMYTWDIPVETFAKFSEENRKTIKPKIEEKWYHVRDRRANHSAPFEASKRIISGLNLTPSQVLERKRREANNVVRLITKHNATTNEDLTEGMAISKLEKFHADWYSPYNKKRHNGYLFHQGYGGQKLNEGTFRDRTKKGCAFCGTVPEWGDNICFCGPLMFLCQGCSGDEGIENTVLTGDPSFAVGSATANTELNDPLPTIN